MPARRAQFWKLAGIRAVTRPHVIAWRKDLERRQLSPSTIRRKLSTLSALFGYLCEYNAIYLNPVNCVERPAADSTKARRRRWVVPSPGTPGEG